MSAQTRVSRLGACGLKLREELVLASMLTLLRPAGSQHAWQYVSNEPCDVRIGNPGAHDPDVPQQVAVVRAGENEQPGLALHWPLRLAALASLLAQLETRMSSQAPVKANQIRVALPGARPAATTAAAPAGVAGSPDAPHAQGLRFAESLYRQVAQEPELLELGLPGQAPILVIECWRKQFLLPGERAPALSADAWMPKLAPLIERCEIRRNPAGRHSYSLSDAPRRSLDRLFWALGALSRGPSLLSWLPADARFRLRRWPDFGALGSPPKYLKLAAPLVRQSLSIDQLVSNVRMAREDVVAFLNSCALCGLLLSEHSSSVGGSVRASPVASSTAKPAAGMRGLLSRIRIALHLG